jgi:hypothetical protein
MNQIGLDGLGPRPPSVSNNGTSVDASDMTSAAGYTPSGTHDEQQEQDSGHVTHQLIQQGFSTGLAQALVNNAGAFHRRIWVVDNSGSMQIGDGHCVVSTNGKILAEPVSRWEEIKDTVIYHSQMAAVLKSPTVFRLLNDPGAKVGQQEFSVAEPGRDPEKDIRTARLVMTRAKPDGVTPLTDHIWEMQAQVRGMLPELQRTGQRVSI